jgi:hypothetical protein
LIRKIRHFLDSCDAIGCPPLAAAQPDPSNRIDYDGLIRFSSSSILSIHVNTLLQSPRPLEKTLN